MHNWLFTFKDTDFVKEILFGKALEGLILLIGVFVILNIRQEFSTQRAIN